MIDGYDETELIDHIYCCVRRSYNMGQSSEEITKAALDLLVEYF